MVLSNRLAKVENLPVWTVCSAQQAIETELTGVKSIIADERLKLGFGGPPTGRRGPGHLIVVDTATLVRCQG